MDTAKTACSERLLPGARAVALIGVTEHEQHATTLTLTLAHNSTDLPLKRTLLAVTDFASRERQCVSDRFEGDGH